MNFATKAVSSEIFTGFMSSQCEKWVV